MSDVASLEVEVREQAGKGAARALRRSGRIPAVIYGDKKDPTPISIDGHTLKLELAQPGFYLRLYDISVNGKNERVLPRDVQRHPVTSVPLHVDFLRIRKGATIAVNVGVVFENEELSPGLKRGGVLNVVRYEVELVCPATAIPESIIVDLTGLDIGDGVHISNITLPDGVEPVISDRDFTIATIASPTVQEEVEEVDDEEIEGEEGVEAADEDGGEDDGGDSE